MFFKIILPLLKPAIVTIIIISGTTIYNDFYTAFLYMPSADLATISTSLFNFKGPYASSWETFWPVSLSLCSDVNRVPYPAKVHFTTVNSGFS